MNAFFAWLKALWAWLWRRRHVSRVIQIESRSELPGNLGFALYVIGRKWAVLKCPCGCGEVIDVNLMKSRKPCWTLTMKDGKATLHPSLWVPNERCGSHFWLRDNRIHWV
jgi:Family of unknown function (DUF6527)